MTLASGKLTGYRPMAIESVRRAAEVCGPLPAPDPSEEPPLPEEARELIEAAQLLASEVAETWMPSFAEAVDNNGLRRELDAVYAGGRSAIAFLKLNFLPSAEPGETAAPKPARG